jgi:hypothetical protein
LRARRSQAATVIPMLEEQHGQAMDVDHVDESFDSNEVVHNNNNNTSAFVRTISPRPAKSKIESTKSKLDHQPIIGKSVCMGETIKALPTPTTPLPPLVRTFLEQHEISLH